MYRVEFYKLPNGKKPVAEFIKSIEDAKLRVKVERQIRLLEEFGKELRRPVSAPLGDGIFELRIIQGNNTARCLYFFFVGERIILTNGFIKKTQKTPADELRIAKERKADFEKRELR